MSKRRDGLATRDQLLTEAAAVFAEHGYHKASVAEICRRAGANGAAINYHFGDKESLYVAIWRGYTERLFQFSEKVAMSGSASQKLEECIRAVMRQMSDEDQFAAVHRLHLHEMINPTGLMDQVIGEFREPFRKKLLEVIRELLGPGATDRIVQQCEVSVISQCRSALMLRKHPDMIGKRKFTAGDMAKMTEHVVAFSMGGIARIRRQCNRAKGNLS